MANNETDDGRLQYEREHHLPADIDLEPITSEDEDYESAPPDYRIATYPADFTLEVLHQKWKATEIRIPDFQRNFVWKQVQSSKLIESFLVGLPVPAVFLYTEQKSQHFFVIDGQQRLKSIFYYFEGYFGEEQNGRRKVFRLSGLSPKSRLMGKGFTDLRDEDQRRLKNAVLRSFVVQQIDPNDDTSMYHIFERLNTGGTLLTNQEIRNSVFHGPFVSFLNKLNRSSAWRAILGKDAPDTRKRDIELLVRFFAMRDLTAYERPMKDFLTRFMKKNQGVAEEAFVRSEETFKKTCDTIVSSLGARPFHVRTGLNAAVFDAVMVAFANHPAKIPDDVKKRYADLLKDESFNRNTRQHTTDTDTVRARCAQAEAFLFG